ILTGVSRSEASEPVKMRRLGIHSLLVVERVETICRVTVSSGLVWAADPCLEGLLDGPRSKGRPAAAGFAGRYRGP
ncbi:hypothetical protein ACFV9G_24885, partial [Nocardioides sp. NPDC059952]|uniref:hypothetical protein n=1 Tax=Nocardioides sp. NPDC059952 TaxID=3347014 RepID=UPI003646D9AD